MKIIGTAEELFYITTAIAQQEWPLYGYQLPIAIPVDELGNMQYTGYIGTVRGMPIELEEIKEKKKELTSYEFEVAAKNAVIQCITQHHGERYTIEDIDMVWFAHVLGNKKAILIDNGNNGGRLYEVIYDISTDILYVHEYDHLNSTVVRPS